MPIYAYRCETCGHAKDVIQKFSDAPLTLCPACGADAFRKQLTAPAFQLKGSGWYVTDFRDQGKKGQAPAKEAEGASPAPAATEAGASAAPAASPGAPTATGPAANAPASGSTAGASSSAAATPPPSGGTSST